MADEKKLVLEATDVSIIFGGLCAVSEFSCELREGGLYGLIGPNGAGKTTLFNMISGIYTPTSGQLSFWDKNGKVRIINKMKPAELNAIGIARTFQNIRLFGNLSVSDNVRIALHSSRTVSPFDVLLRTPKYRRDEKMMSERAMHLLQLFKIDGKKDSLARNLPYGEQRKLEIARALASKPKLLLLDEHTAALDPSNAALVMNLTKRFAESYNLTVMMVTHNMQHALDYGNRLIMMDKGEIIFDIAGTEKKNLTMDDIVQRFRSIKKTALTSDRMILQ